MRWRSIPGVQAVSVTLGSRPMIHDSSLPFWIVGQPKPANDNEMPQAMFYLVEAGFQQAMGMTLKRGRFVTAQDNEYAPLVIDIDDVFARTWFPHENPIGKRVHLEQFNVEAEIVGVVGHMKQWGLGADQKSAVEAQFYYPFMQLPEKLMPTGGGRCRGGAAHGGRSGSRDGTGSARVGATGSSRRDLRGANHGRSGGWIVRRAQGCR